MTVLSLITLLETHLMTVTNTSQMLSSGKIKLGGRLDMKSNPVGNTITLKNLSSQKLFCFDSQNWYLTEFGTGLSTLIWPISCSFSTQSAGSFSLNFSEYSVSTWCDHTPLDLSPFNYYIISLGFAIIIGDLTQNINNFLSINKQVLWNFQSWFNIQICNTYNMNKLVGN